MRIRSLVMKNIRSYVDERMVFPEGSVLLSGDIGSGKSTALLAIEFALFGVIRGAVDGATLLRHGCSNGAVTLVFSLNGQEVTVHRPLKRGAQGIAQAAGYLMVDGVRTDGTPVELKAKVLELLGYPQGLLTKSKALIYRYTVYTPQEEMNRILFEDAPARLDTLRRVFQMDKYRVIRENAAILLRMFREKESVLDALLAGLGQKKQRLEQVMEDEAALAKERAALDAEVASASERVVKQKESLAALEKQVGEAQQLKEQDAAVRQSIEEKTRLIAAYGNEEKDVAEAVAQLRDAGKNMGAVRKECEQGVAELQRSLLDARQALAERERVQDAVTAAEREMTEVAAAMGVQEAAREDATALAEKIRSMQACPLCLQPVTEDHKEVIGREQREKIADVSATVEKLQVRKSEAAERLADMKRRWEQLNAQSVLVAELRRWLEGCEGLADAAPTEKGAENPAFRMESLTPLRKRLEAERSSALVLKEKEMALQQLERKREVLTGEVAALQAEAARLEENLRSEAPVTAQVEEARAMLEELNRQERAAMVKRAAVSEQHAAVTREKETLAAEVALMQKSGQERERLQQLRNWLQEFFINVVAVMEKQVMLRVYHEFNGLFRQWFSMLMGDEAMSARLDDTFSPVVEQNGYETAVQHLSGGEKTSCALAYRLALNRVINDVVGTIRTKGLLILDEPTDGFSTDQLEKVRDVLNELQLQQVILVSHEAKVESFVQHIIRVAKEGGKSHVMAA